MLYTRREILLYCQLFYRLLSRTNRCFKIVLFITDAIIIISTPLLIIRIHVSRATGEAVSTSSLPLILFLSDQ